MRSRPARRLRFLAGASVLATLLVFAFSGFSVASASTTPRPMPGLFGPAMRLVLSLSNELKSLETTVAGFADSFTTQQLTFDRGTGNELDVQTLCIGSTCINEAQLQSLLAGEAASTVQANAAVSDATTTDATTTVDVSPIIQINGDNPAIIQTGDTYNDLGATITGPEQDLNLGITTYLNGTLTSNIVIDTSAAATDTIDYVATDQNGLTSTTTRTVIIEPAAAPTTLLEDEASTTATSTSPF